MTAALLAPFESLLNRQIAASSRARGLLASLAGRSLELRFPPTPFRVRVAASAEALSIRHAAEEPADAVIEGTPLAFLRLLTNASTTTIRAGGLDVRGDAEVAEGFRSLFEAARPDLEEELSRFTGDAAAHHAARLAREAADFGRRAGDALARNLSEFLSEESRDVPARIEVEEFLDGVDRFREAVDRLEARVAALSRPRAP
jgi:ubiquinone biosynthesis protein UbiJ